MLALAASAACRDDRWAPIVGPEASSPLFDPDDPCGATSVTMPGGWCDYEFWALMDEIDFITGPTGCDDFAHRLREMLGAGQIRKASFTNYDLGGVASYTDPGVMGEANDLIEINVNSWWWADWEMGRVLRHEGGHLWSRFGHDEKPLSYFDSWETACWGGTKGLPPEH